MKRPPPGFEKINDKLDEYDAEMRLALSEDPSQAELPVPSKRKDKQNKVEATKDKHAQSVQRGDGGVAGHSDGELDKPEPPLWRVARINRERTRYVFNACFRERIIAEEVLDYCCEMNFIDAGLVRRWSLAGYERLCCNTCCLPGAASEAARMVNKFANRDKKDRRTNGNDDTGGTCICRVPDEKRLAKAFTRCMVCGCSGCGSGG
ncbi:hypothetical protein, conserved [Trypanosoma brucei gambiense DAL972]|nr:hypothetical protein, conserved [Trypanosoma brucei gambiense DAL972]CBH15726.1 hypothetical protein, conserved [Trypanosoma brucei gambiense DAL972]|eukprot:XP_011777990.1 hypothetical protein, conserved [Trypanosoma brucei gambiense DAL972]